jgi:capsular polysaccharide biosynthesis protein
MELNEAFRRIVGGHFLVLLTCLFFGTTAGVLSQRGHAVTYSASARLVLDSGDPQDLVSSQALADSARSIATSPEHVEAALRSIRVQRDAVKVAQHDVSVQPVGNSGTLVLTARDPAPAVAARLANALSADLIKTRIEISSGPALALIDTLNARIDRLNAQINGLDDQIQRLPSGQTGEFRTLSARRTTLVQESQALLAQVESLKAQEAVKPKPAVIQPANRPLHADPSRFIPNVALGAFVGLALGVGVAALLETFRPTLAGTEALSRVLNAPVLEQLPCPPQYTDSYDTIALAARLRLAAVASRVESVELVTAGPLVDIVPLSSELQSLLTTARGAEIVGAPPVLSLAQAIEMSVVRESQVDLVPYEGLRSVRPFSYATGLSKGRDFGSTGLVVVAPTNLKKSDLNQVGDLIRMTGWPLLGLVTYVRPRFLRSARGPRRNTARVEVNR